MPKFVPGSGLYITGRLDNISTIEHNMLETEYRHG